MKNVFKFLVVVLFSTGCHDKIKPVAPAVCDNPFYSRGRELKSVDTYVLVKTSITPMGAITNYYIENPDVPGLGSPYAPCNLPKEFQKDKLAVRISGFQLTWPDMENQNYYGLPIELTRIEER